MHGLLEVDGIEDFDPVRLIDDLAALILHGLAVFAQFGRPALEHLAALHQDGAFRKRFVKTECAFYLQTFYEQLTSCLDGSFIRTWRRCECRF